MKWLFSCSAADRTVIYEPISLLTTWSKVCIQSHLFNRFDIGCLRLESINTVQLSSLNFALTPFTDAELHADVSPISSWQSAIREADTHFPCSYSTVCSCWISSKPFIYWGFLTVSSSWLPALLCDSGRLNSWPAAPPEGSHRNERNRCVLAKVAPSKEPGPEAWHSATFVTFD